MLISVCFWDRGIDKPNIPIVALPLFVVVLQYLNALAPYRYKSIKVSFINGLAIANARYHIRDVDIDVDLTVTHGTFTIHRVRNYDYILFGVVHALVSDFSAYHRLYLALLEHLVNSDCYFLGRYHKAIPNIACALAVALSCKRFITFGNSVLAFSSAGRITL